MSEVSKKMEVLQEKVTTLESQMTQVQEQIETSGNRGTSQLECTCQQTQYDQLEQKLKKEHEQKSKLETELKMEREMRSLLQQQNLDLLQSIKDEVRISYIHFTI